MTAPPNDLSRRDFIRNTTSATLVGVAGTAAAMRPGEPKPGGKSRVVLVRHADAVDQGGKANAEVIQQMTDEGVMALVGEKDVQAAWKRLIKPTDVVGIKSNVWGRLPTPAELEQALKRRVCEAGVDASNVAIDDRGIRRNKVFKRATALINARPMRTHHWSGLGGCIKNYIMFEALPFTFHGRFCSPLGGIWKRPDIQGKTRLNVLVLLTPLFHGVGPHHYDPKHTWPYKGMLFSQDPVAADAIGREIIKAHRKEFFGEERPFKPPTRHIDAAEKEHGIGVADLTKIELIKLGWADGVLV
ncbi:MAG: DUF362 domain-containing protein [Phycisphaerae bacterium]|nr:DUF362 domain-containing protein [Phycisphaerae bacterium]